jgi:hypothetical protein
VRFRPTGGAASWASVLDVMNAEIDLIKTSPCEFDPFPETYRCELSRPKPNSSIGCSRNSSDPSYSNTWMEVFCWLLVASVRACFRSTAMSLSGTCLLRLRPTAQERSPLSVAGRNAVYEYLEAMYEFATGFDTSQDCRQVAKNMMKRQEHVIRRNQGRFSLLIRASSDSK